jgi:hypothetical protein
MYNAGVLGKNLQLFEYPCASRNQKYSFLIENSLNTGAVGLNSGVAGSATDDPETQIPIA